MSKTRVAIIGSGNIGTDLLMKALRSDKLEVTAFVGRRLESDGIRKAESLGVQVAANGINYFDGRDEIDLVFDCTDAFSAKENWDLFKRLGVTVVDMTPAKIGEMCVPVINGDAIRGHHNINMITCGGQASIPILSIVSECCASVDYIEVVSQIASKSAGIATRVNIDQYIHTTEDAISKFTGCSSCKVILNLNPAEPCVDMQTTMFIKAIGLDFGKFQSNLTRRLEQVRQYVPHYDLVMTPVVNDAGILILSVRVKGSGDYLPSYAGNLDIINCAAINVAERV